MAGYPLLYLLQLRENACILVLDIFVHDLFNLIQVGYCKLGIIIKEIQAQILQMENASSL